MNKRLFVGIVDLKINNLFSIYKSCLKASYKVEIVDPKKNFFMYDILILPGVGAFSSGMEYLIKNNFHEKIYHYLDRPNALIYGICLGMQLFFDKSYEFKTTSGLKLIKGKVVKFKKKYGNKEKINIGWSKFTINQKRNRGIFGNLEKNFYYHVHSYYVQPQLKSEIFATSIHNNQKFCSVIRREKIFGTQFHPEKSGAAGISFLKNLKKIKG
jgi:glutamine amidotransferase|tara:strand:- start:675 stop:1313 length:639 start_codon:yes stop_codon:yes gene_type:complete